MSNQQKEGESHRPASPPNWTGQSGNNSGSLLTGADETHSDDQRADATQRPDAASDRVAGDSTTETVESSVEPSTGTSKSDAAADDKKRAANASGNASDPGRTTASQSENAGSVPPDSDAGSQKKTQNTASERQGGAAPPNNPTRAQSGNNNRPPRRKSQILAAIALLVALVALGLVIWHIFFYGQTRLGGLRNETASLKQQVGQLANQNDQQSSRLKTIADDERQHAKELASNQQQLQTLKNSTQSNANTLASTRQQLQSIKNSTQSNANTLASTRQQLQSIKQSTQSNAHTLASTQQQLEAIKKRNQRLANEIAGSQRSWQLRRIRSLLLSANQAAQLEQDPQAALAALELADQRVATLSDPNLLGLRKELAKEMGALRGVPTPDRAGIALRLSDASNRVGELPLANGLPKRFVSSGAKSPSSSSASESSSGTSKANPEKADNTGWAAWAEYLKSAGLRALHTVGHSLAQMVTVRHSNNPPPQLMPPDRAAYLAQNIVLKLHNAEAAILQRHAKLYKKNLASAQQWLKQYFDTSNTKVAALINELGELQNKDVEQHMPDISDSLSTVNKLISKQSTSNTSDDARNQQASQQNSHAAAGQ